MRLPRFLWEPLDRDEARRRIAEGLRTRDRAFLTLLDRAVYRNPPSPYRPLLAAAGTELGDVQALVRADGVEGALTRLWDAGVTISLDEFKRRAPAFDNPLVRGHLEGATGGSRGVRRRVAVDVDALEYEAAHHAVSCDGFDLWGRPLCLWHPVPPAGSGMNNALRQLKVGGAVAAWYSPYKPPRAIEAVKFAAFTRYTVAVARPLGSRLPYPEHCPAEDAGRVARRLATWKREGTPGWLDSQASLAVRACAVATAEGVDLSGTFFRLASEPFTQEKARVIETAGGRAVCHYSMAETSRIAAACADPASFDDMHLLADKLAVLQRDRPIDGTRPTVGALFLTTLRPNAPKVMLNVETGDYARLEERSCECPYGALGLRLHIGAVRSYEKLTSEGTQFLGGDLVELVERVLPTRFGGDPGDYQLVEEEVGGLPKVSVVVRPRLGHLDEGDVVDAVLAHLRSEPSNRLMADVWRDGRTVRVVRREPYLTAAGKILPLHLARTR